MSMLRGFGFTATGGVTRFWYVDNEGVTRWAVGGMPVSQCVTPNPVGATATREVLDERRESQ